MDGPTTSFPNPAVYLNYLDPNTAFQYEVTRNVYLATLGASHLSMVHLNTNTPDDMWFLGYGLGHSVLCPTRLEVTSYQQATTCLFCLPSLEVSPCFSRV